MSKGLLGLGQSYQDMGQSGLTNAAQMERRREQEGEINKANQEAAEKQARGQAAGTGAALGSSIGASYGSWGGPIGMGVGAIVGLAASSLFS